MKQFLTLAGMIVLVVAGIGRVQAAVGDELLEKAAGGNPKAMHRVFEQSLQEAPGEASRPYASQLRELLQTVGKARFTRALQSEPAPVRSRVMFFLNYALSGV